MQVPYCRFWGLIVSKYGVGGGLLGNRRPLLPGYWAVDQRGCVGVHPIAPHTAARLIRVGRATRVGPNTVVVHTTFKRVAAPADIRRQWLLLGPPACWEPPQGPNWTYYSELIAWISERMRPKGRRTRITRLCACRIVLLALLQQRRAHEQRRPRWRTYSPKELWYQRWCVDAMAEYGRGVPEVRKEWRQTLQTHMRRWRLDPAVQALALRKFDQLWAMAHHDQRKLRRRQQIQASDDPQILGLPMADAVEGAEQETTNERVDSVGQGGKADGAPDTPTKIRRKNKTILVLLPVAEGGDPIPDRQRLQLVNALHTAAQEMGAHITTCVAHATHVQIEAKVPGQIPAARFVAVLKERSRAALPERAGRLWGGHYYAVLPDPETAAYREAILHHELATEFDRMRKTQEARAKARAKQAKVTSES